MSHESALRGAFGASEGKKAIGHKANCRPEGRQFASFPGWRTSQRLIATSNGGFHEHSGLHFMNTHGWRWRESNPRPSASHRAFSERSRQLDLGALAAAGEFEGPQPTFGVPGGQSVEPLG